MAEKPRLEADNLPHSKPGSLDQQLEDSFPTSDAPSYSPGAIGAPEERKTTPKTPDSGSVKAAEKKVKTGDAKKPETY